MIKSQTSVQMTPKCKFKWQKSPNTVKKGHKNVYLSDKKRQTNVKKSPKWKWCQKVTTLWKKVKKSNNTNKPSFNFWKNIWKSDIQRTYLITSIKTNYLLNVNLVFYLAIHSYHLLLMTSTLHLTMILHRMLGVYFQILPRLLIMYGTRDFYLS